MPTSRDFLKTIADSLDPDEAPLNMGPHLGIILFDIQIAKSWKQTILFFFNKKKEKKNIEIVCCLFAFALGVFCMVLRFLTENADMAQHR